MHRNIKQRKAFKLCLLIVIILIFILLTAYGVTSMITGGKSFTGRSLMVKIPILLFSTFVTLGLLILFHYSFNSESQWNDKVKETIWAVAKFIKDKRMIFFWILIILMIFANIRLTFWSGHFPPGDLDSFLSSGKAAASGENPYTALTSEGYALFNRNPPVSLLAFMPLKDYTVKQVVPFMRAISAFLLVLSVVLLYVAYRPKTPFVHVAALMAASGFWIIYSVGQIYMFLVFFIVLAWIFMERKRYVLAGIFIGVVVAVKPSFIIWPGLLFLAGYFKLSISAILSTAIVTLLPAPILGFDVYLEWIKLNSTAFLEEGMILPDNMSAFALGCRIGVPWLGFLIVGIIGLAAMIWLFVKKPSLENICKAALVISVLASPFGWTMYAAFFLPIYFVQKWDKFLVISSIILMIPGNTLRYLSSFSHSALVAVGIVSFTACLLLLFSIASSTFSKKQPAELT